MEDFYAGDELPTEGKAFLFLAGPSPRREGGDDTLDFGWRTEALRILGELSYQGVANCCQTSIP